jgi:cell division transport system permease protein
MKQRRKVSYISAILSISMVLLMLGLLGILMIQSIKLGTAIKENMVVQLFLNENINQEQINQIQQKIQAENFAKELKFISKEQAAADFSREIGQDFISFLGFNPLMPSFQIKLKEDFTESDELNRIEGVLKQIPMVIEVSYQRTVFEQASANIQSIGIVLVGLSLLFAIISAILINNTVRLNLYAQRFAIKSMQLVGATHWFIIKPFVWRSVRNGFFGWFISLAILMSILNALPLWIPSIEQLYDTGKFFLLFVFLLVLGIGMSMFSSWLSTKRYLNTKIEDLY